MKDELEVFYQKAIGLGLCEDYTNVWRSLKTKKEFVDFSLRAASIVYMAKARYNGIGLSNKYILENFNAFINGVYVSKPDEKLNYTCEYYVEYSGEIETESNALVIIDCNATIKLRDYQVLTVFTYGKSKLSFTPANNTIIDVKYWGDECTFSGIEENNIKLKKRSNEL